MPRVSLEEGIGLLSEVVVLGKKRHLILTRAEYQLVSDDDRKEVCKDALLLSEWQDQAFMLDYLKK